MAATTSKSNQWWDQSEKGQFVLVSDEDANDSNKTITTPTNFIRKLLWLRVELATTATVGDRRIVVQILDAANDVIYQRQAAVLAASSSANYNFNPGGGATETVDDEVTISLPAEVVIPAGYDLVVKDEDAVDAAADDMIVHAAFLEQQEDIPSYS